MNYTLLYNFFSVSDENLTAAEINDADVRVDCNSDEIIVNIGTRNGRFNGMIYPRGLSKNTHCLTEWVQRKAPITYTLPLRGCNTMSTELVSTVKNMYNIKFKL